MLRKALKPASHRGMDENIKQVIKLPLCCPKCGQYGSLVRDDDIADSVFFSCSKCLNFMILHSDRSFDIWIENNAKTILETDDIGDWQLLKVKNTFVYR